MTYIVCREREGKNEDVLDTLGATRRSLNAGQGEDEEDTDEEDTDEWQETEPGVPEKEREEDESRVMLQE